MIRPSFVVTCRHDVYRHVLWSLPQTVLLILAFGIPLCGWGQSQKSAPGPAFRDPFVLKLRIDDEHTYEQKFGRIPYVAGGDVYIFAGESFGINLTVFGDQVTRVDYAKDVEGGQVRMAFSRDKSSKGWAMNLMIRNSTSHKLFFDALMTLPGKKGVYKTSVVPVGPGLSNYESWPYPVVQLVLSNFRFSESAASVPSP